MSIVTGRPNVLKLYENAAQNRWTLPCFCTENLTTTEAVLEAAYEHGRDLGIDNLPVIVAITNNYAHRQQSRNYTHTRSWELGLKLFLADLEVLAGPGSPYERLRVMVHLDHIQHDLDGELLGWDMTRFSSIMFDASSLPFEENIRLTNAFVTEKGRSIVIEGACDEIVDAAGQKKSELTTVDRAFDYYLRTGVEFVVANLGTEHRASSAQLQYRGDLARQIKSKIGSRIVLHGASSVPPDKIASVFEDGVRKVNLWTALERDSSPALLGAMVRNASKVAGAKAVAELKAEGLLGSACAEGSADIGFFTTVWRQDIVFNRMKEVAKEYFKFWYK